MGSSSCGLPATQDCLLTQLLRGETITVAKCVVCDKPVCVIESELKAIEDELRSSDAAYGSKHAAAHEHVAGSWDTRAYGRVWKWDTSTPKDAGPRHIGCYEVLSVLGRGGMGVVYRVLHSQSGKEFALKTFPEIGRAGEKSKARFEREINSIRRLQHPALVQYVDSDATTEPPYLVMPLIRGINLGAVVSDGRKLSVAEASEVIRQAAIGLSAAHQEMVVHRDVKPNNLMLTIGEDGYVHVRILDFGVAISRGHQYDSTLTEEGQKLGTLEYMSPEQLSDPHNVDCSSDIYSLGATAFRLISGVTPFHEARGNPLKLMIAIRETNAPKLRSLCTDVPSDIAAFIDRMLDPEPGYRPRNMMEVAITFEQYTVGHQLRRRVEQMI